MNVITIKSGSKILHLIRQAITGFELSENKLLIFMNSGVVFEFAPNGENEGINPALSEISEKIRNFLPSTSSVLNVETDIPYKISQFGSVDKPQSNTKRKSK